MKLIVAFCKNGGIGFKNKLPWYLLADMKKFKKLTIGNGNNAVIMGKNTWESLPENFRPLPKRVNIVLTSKAKIYKNEYNNKFDNVNTVFLNSIEAAQDYCKKYTYDDVWVIGGSKLYKTVLDKMLVSNIYATKIENEFKCDTFFPEIPAYFSLKSTSFNKTENNIQYKFTNFISKIF